MRWPTRQPSLQRRSSDSRMPARLAVQNGDFSPVCGDRLLRRCQRTFSPFHRGVVTTDALQVGAAGEGDNRDQPFSAFVAARYPIHGILPISPPNAEPDVLFHSRFTRVGQFNFAAPDGTIVQ